ncbi:MAG: hypothetical protein ACRD4S_11150 [Candidatus Acidiferrales bacterium]
MMNAVRIIGALFLACACAGWTPAQGIADNSPSSNADSDRSLQQRSATLPPTTETIGLNVPRGTPLQVALDKEVRIRKVGDLVYGRIVEPVYAFDKLVVPVGSEVIGNVTKIDPVSRGKRTLAALDADFTPARGVHLEFTELVLPDGKHIAIDTNVTPGSGQVIQFVTAADDPSQKKGLKNVAAEKAKLAKQQAKEQWDTAIGQVEAPGKLHRIERFAIVQLPVHPQYISAGTVYFAELQQPLKFGTEPITPALAASIGTLPPDGVFVHARLVTPLSSATARKGDEVKAIVSQPVFDHAHLIIPQGAQLTGTVLQVHSARSLARSGQLRIAFHRLVLPGELGRKIDAVLAGVQAAQSNNVELDSEGGAKANPPNTRFVDTTVRVGLGAFSFLGDTFGDIGPRTAGGAGGFKLIGIALGASIRSQSLGMAMGAYGGARSIYTHFLAKGQEIVFPKNTAMEIGISTRQANPPAAR